MEDRIEFMLKEAIACEELCKGYTPEQRQANNWISTIESLAGDVQILCHENASFREQLDQRWIPVSDKLPEKSTERKKNIVIGFDGKAYFTVWYTTGGEIEYWNDDEDGFLEAGFYEELEQFNGDTDYHYFKRDVTHWFLPSPPKAN
jgi:hypothetical protein